MPPPQLREQEPQALHGPQPPFTAGCKRPGEAAKSISEPVQPQLLPPRAFPPSPQCPHYLGFQGILLHAAPVPAQPLGFAGGSIGPGQAAILGVAEGLPAAGPAPQLGANVLLRGVGAVLEVLAKDLLALLVQAVQGSLAGQLGRQGDGLGRGVQQAVTWARFKS